MDDYGAPGPVVTFETIWRAGRVPCAVMLLAIVLVVLIIGWSIA
jgi:hypothetical protein